MRVEKAFEGAAAGGALLLRALLRTAEEAAAAAAVVAFAAAVAWTGGGGNGGGGGGGGGGVPADLSPGLAPPASCCLAQATLAAPVPASRLRDGYEHVAAVVVVGDGGETSPFVAEAHRSTCAWASDECTDFPQRGHSTKREPRDADEGADGDDDDDDRARLADVLREASACFLLLESSSAKASMDPENADLLRVPQQQASQASAPGTGGKTQTANYAMPLEDLTKRADFSKYDESVVKDMPEYPGLALLSHVMLKMIQFGSCIGSIASVGVWLKSSDKSFSSLLGRQWPRCAGVGGAAGIFLTVPMMYDKMKTVDLDGLEDRAYRIALNKGVQTVDFYSAVGGVTALLLGFSTRRIGVRRVKKAVEGVSRAVSPWSLMTQGIAVGTVGFSLGSVLGAPVQKPLELLRARGFEVEGGGDDVDRNDPAE
eukprot:g9200.t1